MKKSVGVILVVVLTVAIIGGYFFANSYAQKRARIEVNRLIKESNLEGDVHYKDLKASLFSKNIKLFGVEWFIKKQGETVGELNIKRLVLEGNLDKSYVVKFYEANLVNLNPNSPYGTIGKDIAKIKQGQWDMSKEVGIVKIGFEINGIKINKEIINSAIKKEKESEEIFTKVIKLENPIDIKAKYKLNKKEGILKIDDYELNFKNNLKLKYSLVVSNIDYAGFEELSRQIKKDRNSPIVLLSLLSKLYTLKPLNLYVEIENEGLINRALEFALKNSQTTEEQIKNEIEKSLINTPISAYKDKIENFALAKKDKIKINIENISNLSVADLITRLRTAPFDRVFRLKITN
ncbi:hypothetical protein [Hippea maritima]|uniref:DUF945 domain-containing protein n=1 Tax=Hippea maritima (strain ATCC 700847 / DSM 10411 / MH2) TaxID=760142 RepID=F2LTM6_HIPMA|nr:hypothetical protein [Hippea maritima]AEA33351.1 hypothetical protein Hipma_0374 [Hippea maritima DSM 10411]